MLLRLPFAPSKSVPTALQQERAEPSGSLRSHLTPLPCTQGQRGHCRALEVLPASGASSEPGGWVLAPRLESAGALPACPLSVAMQVWQPKGGRHLDEEGHPLGSGRWTWFSQETEPLLLRTAWRRAERGLGQAVTVARWLSGASELEPLSRSRGCSCLLPARPAAALRTALQAG